MKDFALIVEDDEDLAVIFSEALGAANFETEIIRDGQIAQKRLKEIQPVVVILDMHLPRVSGADLLKQIHEDNRLAGTTTVVVTADARMGETVRDEADFVLIKPTSFTQLRELTSRFHHSEVQEKKPEGS
jgi:DNA-binding response OmpR family regulator